MERRALLGLICSLLIVILVNVELTSLQLIYNPKRSLAKENKLKTANISRPDILLVSDDSGRKYEHSTSLKEFEDALSALGYRRSYDYDVWIESVNGTIIDWKVLSPYSIVIWSFGDSWNWCIERVWTKEGEYLGFAEANAIYEYVKRGGNIIIEGENFARDYEILCHILEEEPILLTKVLQAEVVTAYLNTSGIKISLSHPITRGLPEMAKWIIYTYLQGGLKPVGYGFEVAQHIGSPLDQPFIKCSAIIVTNGVPYGVGSTIFYTFSFYKLPKDYRIKLLDNCIKWFRRFNLSIVISRIIYAKENTVYFIYPDPLDKSFECSLIAGSAVYAICKNPQVQGFVNTENWVLSDGSINASELNDKIICLFGSPDTHPSIKYYGSKKLLDLTTYQFAIEVLRIRTVNTTLFIVASKGWEGMWAAGIYLSKVISKSLTEYDKNFYIFDWRDDGDLIPQIDEIKLYTQVKREDIGGGSTRLMFT